jgi:vacuolar-type H+-ATPase subunit I/STV1
MLADRLPKTAAEEAANREARAAELTRRIARNEAAQKGLMTELADLGDASSAASTAYRQRIRERFNELYDDTAALQAELDQLAAQAGTVTDADLIAQLPYAPALLIEAPDDIREALAAAFEVHCTYRADQGQMTIRATITDATPGIVTALAAAAAARAAAPTADNDTPERSSNACANSKGIAIGDTKRTFTRR